MKLQDSKEPKNQYLDRLLNWYDKTKKEDEVETKKRKEDFINEITKFKKQDIKNTTPESPKGISIWMRIKKTLGIG